MMTMEKSILILLLIFDVCCGVIYKLNDTMYYKMPPVFHLDDHPPCLSDENGLYCYTRLELVSDGPSELLNMIHNFSDHRVKHYNHTRLQRGLCVTDSCKEHYHDVEESDLKVIVERCLNDTFWNKYQLKTKVNSIDCSRREEEISIGYGEYAVAVVCIALVLINFVGSFYDAFYAENNMGKGNAYLLAFSVKRNWEKLTATADVSNPYMERFKSFNGIRSISMALVITVHAVLPFFFAAKTTRIVEAKFDVIFYHLFFNGTPIVQVFFIMSGFLLAFNMERTPEKERPTLLSVPKLILLRWMRLTPVYAILIAITCTWLRIAGSGPLWHAAVIHESDQCLRYAWQNLLYINNYFDDTLCMPQTWYLAADMQLYSLGVFLCVLLKTNASRKIVFSFLFIAGVVIPGVVTYALDLDGVLITSPETIVNFFVYDSTFNNIYKRGHTNLSSFIIGISMGYLVHHLINIKFTIDKYKKYTWMFHLLIPSFLALSCIGSVFYSDAPRPSVYFRALYAIMIKPIFAIIIALYILGVIFKCDDKNRNFLEWPHWATTGRLSYSAYSVHLTVVRIYLGLRHTLTYSMFFNVLFTSVAAITVSFCLAVPLWLFVESPFLQLIKLAFVSGTGPKEKKTVKPEKEKKTAIKN